MKQAGPQHLGETAPAEEMAANSNAPKPKDDHAEEITHDEVAPNIVRNTKPDHVAGHYSIKLGQPLPELCTEFAQAYDIEDRSDKHNESLYCLIYHKGAPIRFSVIYTLKTLFLPHFLTPVASEITMISSLAECRFVVVLPKPKGQSLASFIAANGPMGEDFIANSLVAPLIKVLETLDNLQMMHGSVNPDTIYIDPRTRIISLGECVSAPAGFTQPVLYETTERAMTIPLGKGEGNATADYYALGMVALFTQLGKHPIANPQENSILEQKLIEGSFNVLLKNTEVSPSLTDLYRGLLTDKQAMRWNASQLKDWVKGKYFNLVRIPPPIEATRSLLFNEVQYFNLQALANALYSNWKVAKKFLHEDKLAKWVEGSVGNPEMAELLRYMQKLTSTGYSGSKLLDQEDELVIRTINILHPQGPFRFRNLSVNPNAIGTIITQEFSKKKVETLQILSNTFSNGMYGYIEAFPDKESYNKCLWHLRNACDFISKTGLGFGIERCLYELNPALPCMSPLVSAGFPLTVAQVLELLDKRCEAKDDYPMDRHIAAFIASRINLNNEIRVKGLANYPKFANNTMLHATALLMLAQKESDTKKLKHLTLVMVKHLSSVIEMLHSHTHKKELQENLDKIAKEGSLITLYKLMTDVQFIMRDKSAFTEAQKQYNHLTNQLSKLKGKSTIANLGYHYGLRLAVVMAYILCGVEFFFLVTR